MATRKKHWSKLIEEDGLSIRLYERANSTVVWYGIVRDGKKIRKSLETRDRTLAETRAQIAFSTHRYVRHQETWLRRDRAITWIDAADPGGVNCTPRV